MKLKIILVLLFAGTVIAGCGSTQDTGSDADSTIMDTTMREPTPVDTTMRDTVPTDTMQRDTMQRDTMRRATL
jgi:hypothetical protein